MQRFLSTNEVATRLGVSSTKVREMIANGSLKDCVKVGGEWQIPLEENAEILKGVFFIKRINKKWLSGFVSVLITILTVIGIAVSTGADFGGAKKQMEQWGLISNYPSRQDGEVLIVIATFYHSEGVVDTEAQNKIQKAIKAAAQEVGYGHLRIEVDSQIISEKDTSKAINLGFSKDANIVIWGSDTGTEVVVNFLNLKDPLQPLSNVNILETEKVQLANNPDPYVQFVNLDLPEKMTFLSFFAIGQSYYSEKEYKSAITSIEKAINSVTESKIEGEYLSKAYFRLGWLYEYLGDKDKAIELYGKTIELDPTHSEGAYNNRGTIFADKGYSTKAIADYSMAIQNQPINPIPYLNRATVYAETGESDLAEQDFDTAIELDPESANAYWNRAIFREQEDDITGAIMDYSIVININPNYAYAYITRGTLYAKMGNMERALSDFDTAISIDESNPYFYMKRGAFLAIVSDKDRALKDLNHALQLNPTDKQRKDIEAAINEINSK